MNTIYLDLDGVIIDFSMSACRYYGSKITDISDYPRKAGWDVVAACNMLCEPLGFLPLTATQFWKRLDLNFWETLPMYPGAREFVDKLIVMCGVENICIATSATLDPQCAAGKLHWIQENLPEFDRQYFIGPNKGFLGRPGAVLIDDRQKNCEDFADKGGHTILVPRPWNSLGHLDIDVYAHILERMAWI
jgi:5'(3')-deoxyribonucleotidase